MLHISGPSPDPTESPLCDPTDSVCSWIYHVTGNAWLADGSYYLVVKPFRIALIVVGALLLRSLLRHAIGRAVENIAQGKVPVMLRPLREKMPATIGTTTFFPERRRQRAEAIGSVLKSAVTLVVGSLAGLILLTEFGIQIGPLVAGLGIIGVAVGFGAQTLVQDLIAGLFMLLEDQYGVGDVIDTGEAVGVVESVGLRTVTIRDVRGVLWYVRNGEIVRVGNKSQGWAQIMVDVPIGFVGVGEATAVLQEAVDQFIADPDFADQFLEAPRILGVEQVTVEGAVVRTVCRTTAEQQWTVQRELRKRLTGALEISGIAARIQAARALRPAAPEAEAG